MISAVTIAPVVLQISCVAGLLAIAALAIALSRSKSCTAVVYGATLVICAAALLGSLRWLLGDAANSSDMILPIGLPWLGAHFRLDALASFFLVVVNLGGGAASLFGLGYGHHDPTPHRVLPSLASWALVMARHREPGNARAGYVYLVMASFGTLALLLAFGLLAGPAGGYGFAAIRTAQHTPHVAALVLILMLLGAGSKAGLVPLHVWLPLAHPAAPSHVSALMSGVMTKVAVYGFVRVVFDLLGAPQWWWSVPMLTLGAASAVIGVLSAVLQGDLKRLLAYSTIENIGIVFVGLGLALAFKANDMPAAAALAMTAALFHVLNHSIFKSLLFFGSGAVLTATGERDMEKLGGLIHGMPLTAFTFLAGCMAISALPPLNGFVSEWLIFQAILLSPELPQWGLKFLVPAVGGMLALSAALAAACFVKAFGASFLGRPRTTVAAGAQEVDRWSLAAMFIFASLCLLIGIIPGPIIDTLAPVVNMLVAERMPMQSADPWLSIVPIAESRSSYNGLLVFLFITISTLAAIEVIHRFASRAVRRGPAWDCGFPDPSPATQYTAGGFAQPIRRVFSALFDAREDVAMPAPGDTGAARLTIKLRDLTWDMLYAPVPAAIWFATEKLNHLQFLSIRQYLSLVFVALVALLLGVSIWP